MRINVRVRLDSFDFAHPAEKQCQVLVWLEDVARASYLLPADRFDALRDAEWGDVLDVAHTAMTGWVSDSRSTEARAAVRAWLAVDENRDDLNVAWFQDRARRDPVSRSLMADKTRLTTEVDRLTALVAAMHAAAVGETKPPLLGLVDDVSLTRSSFLAQQNRAETLDGIARHLRTERDRYHSAWHNARERAASAQADADLAEADVERLRKRVAELEAAPSRADVLNEAADDLVAFCPDHGNRDTSYMSCHCPAADDLRRKADGGERE